MTKIGNKVWLILIVLLYFLLRLPYLGYDISNSDALRWHRRSENFLTALKTGDFANTYQHYQPGVTLMLLNAPVKQAAFWLQETYTNEPKTLNNADYFPLIDGISRSVLVLVLFILFVTQLYF